MFSILYNLFVMPIQVVVEMVYSIMFRVLDNEGFAIICVSLVIQTLILPLYKRSDALQEEEQKKQKEMSHWVNHIKKAFKGDERFMILQTYYRQQNYKTIYSLKSSVSILLQIPFFMAAYNYLSHLEALKEVSFLFIKDLGAPDALFTIGGFPINILPILMTLANIISGVIYTRGLPMRAKLQVYGLAAVFLVLLYNSPAGLVLYWTMNNVYSLMKNVVLKLLSPAIQKRQAAKGKRAKEKSFLDKFIPVGEDKKLVLITEVALTVLMGLLIPISVISTSASEFIINDSNPFSLVINNVSIYAGVFIIWFNIFYLLMKKRAKGVFATGLFGIFIVALFDYMVYGNKLGSMNYLLVYMDFPQFSKMTKSLNLLIVLAIFIAIVLIAIKLSKIYKSIAAIIVIGMLALCVINGKKANEAITDYQLNKENYGGNGILTLSKEGKNVVVFMLDRAISGYAPFIFDEFPEVAEQFSDFTYYSNAMAFGLTTNFSTPALFGGYEYTPTEINKRSDESLASKQNEALKVLPKIFSDAGYNITICDPPYAGYHWNPDLTIYDDIDNVSAYVTQGAYMDNKPEIMETNDLQLQKSNFIYYSLVKIVPLWFHNRLYYNGDYCSTCKGDRYEFPESFMQWYTVLSSLNDMTKIDESGSNNLLLLQNSATHEPTILNSPDYVPTNDEVIPEVELSKQTLRTVGGHTLNVYNEDVLSCWSTNVAAYKAVGNWIQYLKDNDVYDNTRIIIVSDHGWGLYDMDISALSDEIVVESAACLLLFKDFNAEGFTASDEFMTTADVPILSMKDIIDNPVNPYTGNPINDDAKFAGPQIITFSGNWDVEVNNGNVFDTSDADWYSVHDNIYDINNWEKIEQ